MKNYLACLLFFFNNTYATKRHPTVLTPEKITTFLAVKKIIEYAHKTAEELKNSCKLEVAEIIELKPRTGQTLQGIYLLTRTYPRFLETPWRLVTLFKKYGYTNPYCYHNPLNALFKEIDPSYSIDPESMATWGYEPNDTYLIRNSFNQAPLRLLGVDLSIFHYKNQEYLKNYPGFRYQIFTVNGAAQFPTPITRTQESYRSEQEILKEWSTLEQMVQKKYAVSKPTSPSTASTSRSDSPSDILNSPFTPTASSKCSLM